MTKRQAEKLLREWQIALRLQDWKVKLEVHTGSTDFADKDGDVVAQPRSLFARIRADGDQTDDNLEETFVHELVHVVLSGMCFEAQRPGIWLAEEEAVYRLTQCIVGLVQKARK